MTAMRGVGRIRRQRRSRKASGQDEEPVDPAVDTEAALAALASFQQITQQMDAKVNTLVGVHLAVAVVVSSRFGSVLEGDGAAKVPLHVWMLTVMLLAAATITGWLTLSAFRPRVAGYVRYNHWALPGRAGPRPVVRPSATALATEAWLAAEAVGRIAATKNRCVRRATVGLLLTILLTLIWLTTLP